MEEVLATNIVRAESPLFLRLGVAAARGPAPDENAVAEFAGVYPDAAMIGELAPAYGLWARHVRNLSLERVVFTRTGPDTRPMIETQDTTEDALIGC